MSIADLANEFTAVLKAGDFGQAEHFWSDDIVSVEAADGPMKEARGRAAVRGKGEWWTANHEVHRFDTAGPYLNGDQFALRFSIEVTFKETGKRHQMEEVAIYTVRDGKIVEERFFY